MKIPVKHFFPILLAALGIIFATTVYFSGFYGTEHGIYTDIGTALNETTEKDVVNKAVNEETIPSVDVPTVEYIGKARIVGEILDYRTLFKFTYSDGTAVSGADETRLIMYLMDIKDSYGNNACETYTTEDIEAMEEISVPFVFDEETKLLYFHKSGIYKVTIKVYYSANTSIVYHFNIPVEVQVR